MVTKTKPTTAANPYTQKKIFVDIDENSRDEILETAGFDLCADNPDQKDFIEKIRDILAKDMQAAIAFANMPMPANVKAELDAIAPLASKLSQLLSSEKLTPPAQVCLLGADSSVVQAILNHASCQKDSRRLQLDELCTILSEISVRAVACSQEIENISPDSGGGTKKKVQRGWAKANADDTLQALAAYFKAAAPYFNDRDLQNEIISQSEDLQVVLNGYLDDFLKICVERASQWIRVE